MIVGLTLESNAKINLFLRIAGKRPDGYHELETIMVPIGLADTMAFAEHDGIVMTCDDSALPVDSRNLVVRAANLLREKYGVKRGAKIDLKKRIPVGAGLGGGSSNATHALKGLNRLWSLGLEDEHLEKLAAELGSDTAFFVRNVPAFATGRGEKLRPLRVLEPIPLLLVNFGFGSSTAWAYRHYRAGGRVPPTPSLDGLTRASAAKLLFNDLEEPVFDKFPILPIALHLLRNQAGVLGAMMSGSGSTLFAILESEAAGPALQETIRTKFSPQVWTCRTQISGGCP